MARSLGLLFLAGGALVAVSLLLPHAAGSNDPALVAVLGVALATGASLFALGARANRTLIAAGVLAGGALISLTVFFSDDPSSAYASMYVWTVAYSAYFLSRRQALAQLVWVGLAYGAVLAFHPEGGSASISRWIQTLASLLVVGLLISWLVRSRAESERSRRHLARLVESSGEAIFGATTEGVIESWNRGAEALFGYRASAAIGRSLTMLVPAERQEELSALMGRVMAGEKVEEHETVRLHEDGHAVYVALNLSPIWGSGGVVIGAAAVARDITERRYLTEKREQLLGQTEALARTDQLTGLANRRAWDEELRRELSRAGRQGWPLWVALVDLDHFKAFNDRHGHLAGDQLLSEAAAMWRAIMRAGDLIARYGGEEFGVLLPNCSRGDAVEVIERLRAAIPMGQSCSAGLALWDGQEDAGTLVSRADVALYEAKHGGRDRLMIVDPGR